MLSRTGLPYVTCAEYLINFGGSATSTASNAMHRMPHNSSGAQNICCSPSQSWPVGSCSLRQPLEAPIAVQIHAGKLKPLHVWPVHCCNSQCCHATPIIMCRNVAICPKIHAELLQLWPSWSCCGQHLTTLRPNAMVGVQCQPLEQWPAAGMACQCMQRACTRCAHPVPQLQASQLAPIVGRCGECHIDLAAHAQV